MEAPERTSRKIFWGWYVVAGAFTIFVINYGARYCFGVFLKPMCEDLGWSRSVVSFAASLGVLFYGIGGILSGRLLDRFAPCRIITVGALSAGLGFILTRFVSTPLQFYLAYGVLFGLGSSCLGVVVGNSSVAKWFIRKRGIALAISTNGAGAGMLILTPLAGIIVQSFDWQMGFTVIGIAVFLLCTALAQILMGRTHPEDYGLLPDGDETRPIAGAEAAPPRPDAKAAGRPVTRRLLTDGRFWIIASCFNVAVAVEMCAFTHQIAHAEGYGINPVAAASSMGIVSVASIAGRFFFGWLCDRISDVKLVACIGFLFMAAGMGIILFAKSLTVFYLYSVVIGFGWGSTGVMMPILIVDRFGREVMGTAYGLVVFVAVGLGGSIGPVFGGLIYDRFGSYFYAWLTNMVCLIAVSILMLSLKKGRPASI
ncbi:MAG: MFS transporter [Deltaproteobacteria bacterium]|nr:MFS transporter [Deltaproteobacteria bacterium]